MELNIPSFGEFHIKYLVFDLNGTLGLDGIIPESVRERLLRLAPEFELYILTSDTHGTLGQQAKGLLVTTKLIEGSHAAEVKLAYVKELGAEQVIAFGNGRNDVLMLQEAAIGIAILGQEGAASQAIQAADLVFRSVEDALDAVFKSARLVAGLRG